MTPAAIVQTLRTRGYRLVADGDDLHIEADRDDLDLTAEQQEWLARHKSELLAHLTRRCCSTCCWFEPAILPTFFNQQQTGSPGSPGSPVEQTSGPACWLCATPIPLQDPTGFECGSWSQRHLSLVTAENRTAP